MARKGARRLGKDSDTSADRLCAVLFAARAARSAPAAPPAAIRGVRPGVAHAGRPGRGGATNLVGRAVGASWTRPEAPPMWDTRHSRRGGGFCSNLCCRPESRPTALCAPGGRRWRWSCLQKHRGGAGRGGAGLGTRYVLEKELTCHRQVPALSDFALPPRAPARAARGQGGGGGVEGAVAGTPFICAGVWDSHFARTAAAAAAAAARRRQATCEPIAFGNSPAVLSTVAASASCFDAKASATPPLARCNA